MYTPTEFKRVHTVQTIHIFHKLHLENYHFIELVLFNHLIIKYRFLLFLLITALYSAISAAQVQIGNDIDGEAAFDGSGISVSMPDANTVAIGASYNDGNGTQAGQVRIYAWNGSSWQQKGADIDGEAAGDQSGWSVSMPDANTVAIGALWNDGNGTVAGQVRIYAWNGSSWQQKGVDIDGEAAGDWSGYSVSMPDANTVAIGAPWNYVSGTALGQVRIYAWNGSSWLQKGVDIDGEAGGDQSGYSVSMPDANTVAIGAIWNDGNGYIAGHVRIYAWNGTSWQQKGADIDGEAAGDRSGWSVSMPDANTVAIGASYNDGNGTQAGQVRIYAWNGSSWQQKGADIDGEAAGDHSGRSVSMPDAHTVAIGARNNSGNGTEAGHVRIYSLCATTSTLTVSSCDSLISPSGQYTWYSSGTYQDTLTNAAGCDSIVTLNLVINSSFSQTDVITACDSYFWRGQTYIVSGTYFDSLTSSAGCDSVYVLDLTINNASTSTLTETACDQYLSPSGKVFTASGTYLDTIPNSTGCDSLMTINLTVLQSTTASFSASACDAYSWLGNTLTASGTYVDTLVNGAGCDSIVTLNLVINSSFSQTDVITACDSYFWRGQTYIVSGTYFDSLTSSAGCDSVYVLDLTINYTSTSTLTESSCDQYLSPSGKVLTASGTYLDTIPNSVGCDSLMIINLTVLQSTSASFSAAACDAYSWLGNSLTASGTYVDTLVNAVGCDSIVTLNLVINSSFSQMDVITACDSYLWRGQNFTVSGTYFDSLTSSAGCDSVYVLDLTINNASTSTLTETACDQYLSPSGKVFTASGTYLDTVPNSVGCDSIVTLDLTILNSSIATDVQFACDSFTWIDGNTYTASNNTAVFTLANAEGCDSIVTLDLTILKSTSATDVQTACDSYTWIDGNTYSSSNNSATFTLTNAAGCDSVVTLDLTILQSTSAIDVQTACDSYTWIDGNTYNASNNTATFTLTNAAGCDSIVTLDLTILQSTSATDAQTACDSYTWIDGNTYSASNNTATFTLTNAAGCDSVVTLDLTILNSTTATDIQVACDTFTWINGITYNSSNSAATHVLTNAVGCDSIVTLDLTILNSSIATDVQFACDSYTWIDGNTYSSSNNTATFTLPNSAGCDSVVTLDLTILQSTTATDVQTACDSYTWIDGNTYTTSNNTATVTFTNVAGCDSVITLDLTINSVSDTSVFIQGDTLFANNANATYQWLDCNNGYSPIPGETGAFFAPSASGTYAVELTENGCSDTSRCVPFVLSSIRTQESGSDITLFPNPNDGHFYLHFEDVGAAKTVFIYAASGQLIESRPVKTETMEIDHNLSSGIYFIEVERIDGKRVQKKMVVK